MRKIGFNLSSFSKNQVGIKVHIVNLLKNLSFKKKYTIYLYISKDSIGLINEELIKQSKLVYLPLSSKYKILKLFYEQILIPIHAYFNKVDFLHSFDYSNPIFYPYKKSITIHDLNFINNPKTFSFFQKMIRKILYPFGLKKSNKIFTISKTIKSEILNYCNYNNLDSKIEVIYNGYDHLLNDSKSNDKNNNIYNPYFLTIGTLNQHKNYVRLIQSFKKIKSDYKLVIIGRDNNYKSILNTVINKNNLHNRIKIITDVSNEELICFYRGAYAVVLPSLYEGFGIPMVESLFYKKHILCSDIPIFKEIGETLPYYFNPTEIDHITLTINNFILDKDKNYDYKLRDKILNKYKWSNSSQKLFDMIIDEL